MNNTHAIHFSITNVIKMSFSVVISIHSKYHHFFPYFIPILPPMFYLIPAIPYHFMSRVLPHLSKTPKNNLTPFWCVLIPWVVASSTLAAPGWTGCGFLSSPPHPRWPLFSAETWREERAFQQRRRLSDPPPARSPRSPRRMKKETSRKVCPSWYPSIPEMHEMQTWPTEQLGWTFFASMLFRPLNQDKGRQSQMGWNDVLFKAFMSDRD